MLDSGLLFCCDLTIGWLKANATESAILAKPLAMVSTAEYFTFAPFAFSLFQSDPTGGLSLLLCLPESVASVHSLYRIVIVGGDSNGRL